MKKAIWIVLIVFVGSTLRADFLTLTNGNKIRGRVIKITKREIFVEVPGGKVRLQINEVSMIRKEPLQKYYLHQAQVLFLWGSFEQAQQYYEKIIQFYPRQAEKGIRACLFQRGKKSFDEKNFPESKRFFREFFRANPLSVRFWAYWGAMEQIVIRWEALVQRAKKMENRGMYDSSLNLQKKSLKLRPLQSEKILLSLSRTYLLLSKKFYKKKDFQKSGYFLKQAISLQPTLFDQYGKTFLNCQMYLVRDYFLKRHYQKARSLLTRLQLLDPANAKILYFWALLQHSKKKYILASNLYYRILGQKPPRGIINIVKLQQKVEKAVLKKLPGWPKKKKKARKIQGKTWQKERVGLFLIYHHNRKLAKRIKIFLRYYYPKIRQILQIPTGKNHLRPLCKIYIHPTKEAFLKQVPSSHLQGYSKVQVYFGRPVGAELHTYQSAPLLFSRTLIHHLAHLVFSYARPYSLTSPLWIREGFALLCEPPLMRDHSRLKTYLFLHSPKKGPTRSFFELRKFPKNKKAFLFLSHSLLSYLTGKFSQTQVETFFENSTLFPQKSLMEVFDFENWDHFRLEWRRWAKKSLRKQGKEVF